jgi:hemoglobin-like flavoprotein
MFGEHVDVFQASAQRCLESPSFIKDFYDRFTGTSAEIREKFRDTDFARQHRAMADSLRVMAMAVQGGPDNLARHAMKRLAARHGEMHIGAAMYDVWLDCMLQTARAHDPQFSPAVESAWRETLAPAIEYMRAGVPFPT